MAEIIPRAWTELAPRTWRKKFSNIVHRWAPFWGRFESVLSVTKIIECFSNFFSRVHHEWSYKLLPRVLFVCFKFNSNLIQSLRNRALGFDEREPFSILRDRKRTPLTMLHYGLLQRLATNQNKMQYGFTLKPNLNNVIIHSHTLTKLSFEFAQCFETWRQVRQTALTCGEPRSSGFDRQDLKKNNRVQMLLHSAQSRIGWMSNDDQPNSPSPARV